MILNPNTGRPIENVTVYGYRWFQKLYGNTYHTVIVFIDGEEFYRSEHMHYGYDRQFEQTGFDAVAKILGLSDKDEPGYRTPRRYWEDHGVKYNANATDGLKRDLFAFMPFGPRHD